MWYMHVIITLACTINCTFTRFALFLVFNPACYFCEEGFNLDD